MRVATHVTKAPTITTGGLRKRALLGTLQVPYARGEIKEWLFTVWIYGCLIYLSCEQHGLRAPKLSRSLTPFARYVRQQRARNIWWPLQLEGPSAPSTAPTKRSTITKTNTIPSPPPQRTKRDKKQRDPWSTLHGSKASEPSLFSSRKKSKFVEHKH